MTQQPVVQKGWVYEEDGLIVYRASSLYSCLRSMVACRTGESQAGPHASLRAAMDASSNLEEPLLRRVAEQLTGNLIWQQKRFDWEVYDNVVVRMHIDAMHQETDTIVEAKALGDRLWGQYVDGGLDAMGMLGQKYKWQGAVQGYATGRKVRFAVGHKVKVTERHGAGGLDLPQSELVGWVLDEVRVSHPYSPEELVPRDVIEHRLRLVEEFASRDELPECDFDCRPGDPFDEVHIFPQAEQGSDDLEALLLRYDELDDRIKDLTDEKGELRDRLIEEYGFQKYATTQCGLNIIRVKGSMKLDSKWVKKNYPDVYDAGLKMSPPTIRVDVDGPMKRARKKGKRDEEIDRPQ